METHEFKQYDFGSVLKVPGGWVYTIQRLDKNQISSVFVPEPPTKGHGE
jgi:hypothetical protein